MIMDTHRGEGEACDPLMGIVFIHTGTQDGC